MNWLHDWIRTIIILVFFAGCLELLLPSGNMKPMVQVLVGLFVLLILLGPVTAVMDYIRHQWEPDLAGAGLDQTATKEILSQGKELEKQQFEQVLVQYKASVEQQVLSLLRLRAESTPVQVKVNLEDSAEKADFGQLQSLEVILAPGAGGEKETEPEQLAALLADCYGLALDKVVVRWGY